jgi:hypothetical protein
MISNNLEAGAHYDGMNSAESEMLSENNESSFYQKQDSSDRGGTEPKRKLKKLRSIKLSRLPSQRSSTRRSKFRNDHHPVTLSEASPNYMKATNSSDARKESLQASFFVISEFSFCCNYSSKGYPNFLTPNIASSGQNSTTMSTRRSSLNPGKSLTRMSSLKYRRNLMSKSSGGTDLQRKVKRSRSIKKASSSTRSVESGYQASSQNSESSSSSNHHQNRKKLISDPKPKSGFSGNKSVRMMARTSSLKPVKVLTKMGTFKSKKPSITKCSEICKATCSSTLKDSKIPGSLGLQPGKRESERASVTDVCPYSYCSLHGHHHNASPPLKRFVYMRRRLLKTQMGMKRESQFLKGKRSGNMKKGIQAKEMLHNSTRALSHVKEKAGRDFSANGNEVEYKMQSKNQKYIKAWHSIYKHALVGIGRKVENQIHLDGLDSEEQVENTNNCDPSEALSESDHQKNELSQIDAVKLVQEAFDEILLQEFQDRSSDDQSMTSSISSGQELLEKSHVKGGEWSISASSEPATDNMVENPEETLLEADSLSTPKEEKSDKRMPKSWSKLKSLILLKRFVKALEKVRNFNPRRPQYLSLKPDPEAEKVHLRHQTTNNRKNSEEWMLDNALQQVISKLAPAQKRKVALLVEAFEKILPLPEIETPQRSNSAVCSQANPVQACNGSSIQSREETSYPEKDIKCYPEQVSDFHTDKQQTPPLKFSELRETSLECYCSKAEQEITASQPTNEDWEEKQVIAIDLERVDNKFVLADNQPDSIISCSPEIKDPSSSEEFSLKPEGIVSTCHEVVRENGKVSIGNTSSSELCNHGSESGCKDSETDVLVSAPCEQSDMHEIPTSENYVESKAINSVANAAWLEKKKNMRLWCLVYNHMVSGIAAKDEAGKEEQVDEADSLPVTSISSSCQNFSEMDNKADDQTVKLHHIEAIKLVEEAIDEILLPEISEEERGDTGKPFISNCKDSDKESFTKSGKTDPEEKWITSDNISAEEEEKTAAMKVEKKSNQQMPRKWSILKKLILLNRFIKGLEKVRKFNPRRPRYLPLEPDPEGETVNLRHLDMDQRKNSEEWMLDYALQQVVSKLTPERKRKVELLVHAFESVSPTIGS